jgi:hypothetical protein
VRKSQPYLDARGNPTELPPTHSNGQPLVEFEGGRRVYWRDERAQYTGGNFEVGSIVDAGDVGDGRQAIMTPNNVQDSIEFVVSPLRFAFQVGDIP